MIASSQRQALTSTTGYPCCSQATGDKATVFMFNNAPGDADDPSYRNPKLTGNISYEIDFRANVGHNVTVVIWSEYENVYEIDQWGGILYSINS